PAYGSTRAKKGLAITADPATSAKRELLTGTARPRVIGNVRDTTQSEGVPRDRRLPHSRPANSTTRDRHLGAALGPDLELLARRQGQLPGGPRRRGPVSRGLPRDRRHRPPPGSAAPGPSAPWPVRPRSASSWTSVPACRPPTTPTRWPSGSPPTPGSSMSTPTRWS